MRALVTGATSGIGRSIATVLSSRGYTLVLVARDAVKLGQVADGLEAEYGSTCEVLPADLSTAAGIAIVERRLQSAFDSVDVLVNNAGIGLSSGGYLLNPIESSVGMNALNIDAVMRLSHAALPGMIERGRGGLITVSSIAGFLPGTAAITYSASKAWATAFGEGLHTFLRGSGVTSTTVTPGFVRSEFHRRSGVSMDGLPGWLWLKADDVARSAVAGFEGGRSLVVPGTFWRLWQAVFGRLPRVWGRIAFVRLMAEIQKAGAA